MKDSKIVMMAAERLLTHKNKFSCCALSFVHDSEDPTGALVKPYSDLFKPNKRNRSIAWLEGKFNTEKEEKQWRVLALLFFAEILKSEGR